MQKLLVVWTRLAVSEMRRKSWILDIFLKVESISFTDRLIVHMKHKEESRMTPRCVAV